MSLILTYPAHLERDGPNEWAVVFPDVPEAVFGASTDEEAWAQSSDVLTLALCSYPARNLPFPKPGRLSKGGRMISVPAIQSAKLFIRQSMAAQNMNVADLARLMKTDHKSARRAVSLAHKTRMDQLEAVLGILGVRVALMAA